MTIPCFSGPNSMTCKSTFTKNGGTSTSWGNICLTSIFFKWDYCISKHSRLAFFWKKIDLIYFGLKTQVADIESKSLTKLKGLWRLRRPTDQLLSFIIKSTKLIGEWLMFCSRQGPGEPCANFFKAFFFHFWTIFFHKKGRCQKNKGSLQQSIFSIFGPFFPQKKVAVKKIRDLFNKNVAAG